VQNPAKKKRNSVSADRVVQSTATKDRHEGLVVAEVEFDRGEPRKIFPGPGWAWATMSPCDPAALTIQKHKQSTCFCFLAAGFQVSTESRRRSQLVTLTPSLLHQPDPQPRPATCGSVSNAPSTKMSIQASPTPRSFAPDHVGEIMLHRGKSAEPRSRYRETTAIPNNSNAQQNPHE